MILSLDILLFLALISTITVGILVRQPTGPEGAMGIWILLLIPCLFAAILLFTMVSKGLLDLIPGGQSLQLLIAAGILVSFSIAILGTLDNQNNIVQVLMIVIPCLILLGCAAIIHQTHLPESNLLRWATVILVGGAAIVGWGLTGTGLVLYMKSEMKRSALEAQKQSEEEEKNKQLEADAYAKLDDSASLYSLLGFIWSRNETVRQQAQEKVSQFPKLDDKLIELIDLDSKDAISYITKLYDNPPAKFAPAWGKMLKRQIKKWDNLQYDQYAGNWKYNLIDYFEGTQKLQLAGGSFNQELLLWHQHLQKCTGLESLEAFVKSLLETKSKP